MRGSARSLVVFVAGVMALAGCTNSAPAPQQPAPESSDALAGEGVPSVVPQPEDITRLGDDVAVRGKVEVVVDPLVDRQTQDLARRVFDLAGADEVVVRPPGAPAGDAALRVRIGERTSPTVVKGLQEARMGAPVPMEREAYVLAVRPDADAEVFIGASDPAGAYYGVQTLRQLITPGRVAGVGVLDRPAMPLRGAIEGFYGPPWTHQERMDQLAFYGDVKLNTYVYAPKDDPYHREKWREPYPEQELGEVRDLIRQAGAHHVKFTFALSPGGSICYSDPRDFQAVQAKLQAMYDEGVRDFSLPLDDISYTRWNCAGDERVYGRPSEGAAGRAQADLLNRVQREFVDTHPGVAPLQFVPTEYSDVDDSAYKSAIREVLDPRVLVMWTGDGVIPRQITKADAQKAAAVWGREVFLWDNYPVNDFNGSRGRIMLGSYDKRERGLSDQLAGDVVNPMNQAAASKVVEIGAADFAWNDEDFDPQRAWRAAAEYLAGERLAGDEPGLQADPATVEALLVFFDLEHMAPVANGSAWLPPAPELSRRLDAFHAAWAGGDRQAAARDLRAYAQLIADAPERIRSGAPQDFVTDTSHWLAATDQWGQALLATTAGLEARAAGDESLARARFDEARWAVDAAKRIRSTTAEVRPAGQVLVADGVLDTFLAQAPGMR
ncbi:beta-N-acetylhexosaminidase family protein [Saccharopolyspora rhizosphaerae]|nr:beta-N-acetylglucosaminidase domain-containing protein [Saccharopolyspora rhizosphaerae]